MLNMAYNEIPYERNNMHIWKRKTEKSGLEEAIDTLLTEMTNFSGDDVEYAKMTEQLSKLYALKEIDTPDRVKRDTLAIVAGNIAIALLIIGFEQSHVVTTKVQAFQTKFR